MVAFYTGHQVRCIVYVQVAKLNKMVGFLCGSKFLSLNVFCEELLTTKSMFGAAIMLKNISQRCANK